MKKSIITTIATVVLVMSSLAPALAAQTTNNADPTAAQVAAGLLKVYATQQVWPKGLVTPGFPGQKTDPRMNWANNATPTPRSAWYGLSTVFPGQPSRDYAKLLGMTNTPQNKPITAGTLAQWLMNWQLTARIPKEQQHMMKYQPSQDPYTLMSDYSFFYGTDFKNANSVVTAHDLQMVEKNIHDVDQCYRVLGANKIELLRPMAMVWGYGKNASITPQAQALQETDHTILTFGKNRVTVDPTVVLSPFSVAATYFKNLSSGVLRGAQVYEFSKSKPVTINAFLTKKTTGHFQASEVETDETGQLLPTSIGFNKPFLMFRLSGAGFSSPGYYFTFGSSGKVSGIYVQGFSDNSWPIYEASPYN